METDRYEQANSASELRMLRIVCLFSGIAAPVIAVTLVLGGGVLPLVIPTGIIVSFLLFSILGLTYTSSSIKKHTYPILYTISYSLSVVLVYFIAITKFSPAYMLILTLIVISMLLHVKRISYFVHYVAGIFALLILAALILNYTSSATIFPITFFLILCLESYIYLKIKKRMERELTEQAENYRNLIEASPLAIVVHEEGTITYANPAAIRLTKARRIEDLLGKPIDDFILGDYKIQVGQRVKKILSGNKLDCTEIRIKGFDGKEKYVESNMISVNRNGTPSAVSILKDITERRKIDEKIKHMAYFDALTGLLNRNSLNVDLNAMLGANTGDLRFGVMFIDLDRFKTINDTLGHNYGDIVLVQASERLLQRLDGSDTVYRYGGDEFVVILNNSDRNDSSAAARKILAEFDRPFTIENQDVYISPSIGISFYPNDGSDADTLIKNADAAMYHAKDSGRNNFQFFTSALNDAITRKMALENGLRRALGNNEFLLYYQPQIELKTGEIIGVEALIRWNHPKMGMVPPLEFITIAEETGLINPIGEWVLRTACRQNKAWQDRGYPPFPISVNISGVQFKQANFLETLKSILLETGLDPHFLEIEMTESVIQEIMNMTQMVKDLKSMGIRIALDDFGTGYSSINLLKYLNIDSLKIDPSFTRDIAANPNSEILLKFVVEMGHNLNLNIVAEGIEYKQQINVLSKYDCDVVQGYYFSKPQPAAQVEALLQSGRAFRELCDDPSSSPKAIAK